jgi:hypothetical protein
MLLFFIAANPLNLVLHFSVLSVSPWLAPFLG